VLALASVTALALALTWFFLQLWDFNAFLAWKREAGFGVYFLGLALLPLLGMPLTPLFVLAGATFDLSAALFGSALAIAANLALSYALAQRWLRRPLLALLRRWRYELPRFADGQALRFIVVVRLTPGLPAFLKNYVTALTDMPFALYLGVSWMITFGYAIGLIVLGDSLINTDLVEGLWAAAILTAALLVWVWLARRQRQPGQQP
jgi:uncharacterized membrane protein YdjX (TVP38/TMEM64 family)